MKKTKRKPGSKKSNAPKILLGLTVLGGAIYAGYQFWYKPMQDKKAAEDAAAAAAAAGGGVIGGAGGSGAAAGITPLINQVINNAQNTPTNTIPKSNLSPIGTDPKKINWAAKVKYGDKGGEVEVIQKLFNAIAKISGSYTIGVDGIFGNETLAKKRANFGGVYTITPKQVYDKLQARKKAAANENIDKAILDSLPSWMN